MYAFPMGCVDNFYISATSHPNHISGKSEWITDEKGKLISVDNPDYHFTDTEDKEGNFIVRYSKPLIELIKKKGYQVYYISDAPSDKACAYDTSSWKFSNPDCYDCEKGFLPCKKDENRFLYYVKKPNIFTHKRKIWHHLTDFIPKKKVIRSSGTWVFSKYKDYLLAFDLFRREYQRMNPHCRFKGLYGIDSYKAEVFIDNYY
jgi:hypothetical protein